MKLQMKFYDMKSYISNQDTLIKTAERVKLQIVSFDKSLNTL